MQKMFKNEERYREYGNGFEDKVEKYSEEKCRYLLEVLKYVKDLGLPSADLQEYANEIIPTYYL